ncbi:transposable element Tcb2 transposase [Trichonephila clavipes]|nr:transposable element Tcb2 transposase [Trichonephila clavipes]
MANNQSVRRHLDAFTRGRIIGKLEEGRSVTSVAAEFGIAHSIVSRLWRQFQTTGTAIRGFSSGRPRGTTPADDRYIVLKARRNRRQTAGEIARHTTQATGRPISRFTVARRLHGGGLFARRPARCVPLTPAHRRRRSLRCREHRNSRDNEWGRVLFTDESRFSLSSDSYRILIWRERGSRNHPSNIIERDRYGGRGVLVWGGIMLGSLTDLHIFDACSVNGTRYCNGILLPYVRLFRGAMGPQFLFMDDNASCHRTVASEQLLESEDVERMDRPARSPDFNPIKHVWDFLGRRLAARTLLPVTIRELRLALQDEWAAMPQQLIGTLILSMVRRCETCLAVREIIFPAKDRLFLAGHPSQGCFGLQSHCAPCYFFNQASFYPSDFFFNIDECQENDNSCHDTAICVNNIGSYTCQCEKGYRGENCRCSEVEKYEACEDIDECREDSWACPPWEDIQCYNLPGTYKCMCRPGYQPVNMNVSPQDTRCEEYKKSWVPAIIVIVITLFMIIFTVWIHKCVKKC